MSWYHCIDLGEFVTRGTFDLRPHLKHYGFPEDMRGMTVLDVGRSSGFFSFELERRGAAVTATELPTPIEKDYVGGDITKRMLSEHLGAHERTDFYTAHKLLGSRVLPLQAAMHDLPEALAGRRFDLVFVGSVLNHVRDPAGALQKLFQVTAGRIIVANPVGWSWTRKPRLRLIGMDGPGLTTWWIPNLPAIEHLMRAAGFLGVRVVSKFTMRSSSGEKVPHAVLHAERRSDEETEAAFARVARAYYKLS